MITCQVRIPAINSTISISIRNATLSNKTQSPIEKAEDKKICYAEQNTRRNRLTNRETKAYQAVTGTNLITQSNNVQIPSLKFASRDGVAGIYKQNL